MWIQTQNNMYVYTIDDFFSLKTALYYFFIANKLFIVSNYTKGIYGGFRQNVQIACFWMESHKINMFSGDGGRFLGVIIRRF